MRVLSSSGFRLGVLGVCLCTPLALTGCRAVMGTAPDPFDPASSAEFEHGGPDQILASEIRARGHMHATALRLVQRLRPGWLQRRGANRINDDVAYPVVYVDDVRYGPVSSLASIPSNQVRRLQFIGASDATTRWGTGHMAGVINVVTTR